MSDAGVDVDLRIEEPAWSETLDDIETVCLRAIEAAAARTDSGAVSVLLTDNAAIRDLNRTWREKDAPTDVLSFPADHVFRPFLGDIVLAHGVAVRDATDQGKSLPDHIAHLVIHGYLHLLGYDHTTKDDARIMEALETEVLASLGISDPYCIGG